MSKVLYFDGVRYAASTIKQILDNMAQDKGFQDYEHYMETKNV